MQVKILFFIFALAVEPTQFNQRAACMQVHTYLHIHAHATVFSFARAQAQRYHCYSTGS
jgi:hypothetical protein